MGHAISSLQQSVGTIVDEPILLAGVGGTFTLAMFVVTVFNMIPLLGMFVGPIVSIVVYPLVIAGALTMAHRALTGTPALGDVTDGASEYGTSLMGAYALIYAAWIAVSFVLVFVLLFGSSFAVEVAEGGAADSGDPLAMLGTGMLLLLLAIVLVGAVVSMVLQFVDVAVVIGEASAIESFGVAAKTALGAPVSVVGYSVLRFLVTGVPVGIVTGGSMVAAMGMVGEDGSGWFWVVLLPMAAMLIVGPLAATVSYVYHATYFANLGEELGIVSTSGASGTGGPAGRRETAAAESNW